MDFFDKLALAILLWGLALFLAAAATVGITQPPATRKLLASSAVCLLAATAVWVLT